MRLYTVPICACARNRDYALAMTQRASDDLDPVAAWRAMLIAHNRALRAIEHDLAVAGSIPLTWYDVLLELHGAGGSLRMQDLGERVVLSRTRVSRLVGELATDGLVRKETDPGDGRSTFAVITPAGARALRRTAPVYLAAIDRHFTAYLSISQQRNIAIGLERVVGAHEPQ